MGKRLSKDRRVACLLRVFYRYELLAVSLHHDSGRAAMSMGDVAYWGNLSASSYLMTRLRLMVSLGWLVEQPSLYRAHIMASYFRLTALGRSIARAMEMEME